MFPSVCRGLSPNSPPTLFSICPSDQSVLDEFPNDVPVVISLYDLLEALASRNSFLRPQIVLSTDTPPHLRGITPIYASLAISLATPTAPRPTCVETHVVFSSFYRADDGSMQVLAGGPFYPNTFWLVRSFLA